MPCAVPQLVVLLALLFSWLVTTVFPWFAILVTGRYSAGLYGLGTGVLRWMVPVETCLLLLYDEYPPFGLRSSTE